MQRSFIVHIAINAAHHGLLLNRKYNGGAALSKPKQLNLERGFAQWENNTS
jgi:hypothetical protein